MKKQYQVTIGCCLFSLLLNACTEEFENINANEIEECIFTAKDFVYTTNSRTSFNITDKGAEFSWNSEDTVGIFPDKGTQVYFPMESGSGTKNAAFTGGGWALKASSTYAAYYPFIGQMYLDKTSIPMNYVGQIQTANGSTAHLGKYDYMAAQATTPENGNVNFEFDHLGALVRFVIPTPRNSEVNRMYYTGLKLTSEGLFTTKASLNLLTKETTSLETSNTITLDISNVGNTFESTNLELYMMMYPTDLSNCSIKATIVANSTAYGAVEQDYYTTTFAGKNLKAGNIYQFEEINKALELTVETPGTLNEKLNGFDLTDIDELKISGTLNNTDIITIRKMIGLKKLNIENVTFTSVDSENDHYIYTVDSYYNDVYIAISNYTDGVYGTSMFTTLALLESVVWTKNLPIVPAGTFSGCSKLKNIEFKGELHTISSGAFSGCAFESFEIPATVSSISNPFSGCSSLETLTVASGNANYVSEGGVLYNIDKTKLIMAPPSLSGEYVIPNTVTSVASSAFSGTKITSISIGANLKNVPSSLCSGCKNLTTVKLAEGIQSIGGYAFSGCSNLTQITLPSTLISIEDFSFRGTGLTNITIPEGVTSIGSYAFRGSKLKSISLPSTLQYIRVGAFLDNRPEVIYFHCLLNVFIEATIEDSERLDGPFDSSSSDKYCTVHIKKGTTISDWSEKILSLEYIAKEVIADL